MPTRNSHHKIVIVGGGSADISVAVRLLSAGEKDVAVIDPAEVRYYQPLWTLVGAAGREPGSQPAPRPR
jgi:sulfide:quinone oxidoreductase